MEHKPVDPRVMAVCQDVAETGTFWRDVTHGKQDCKDVNVAVSLASQKPRSNAMPPRLMKFSCWEGKVIKPALAEFHTTPVETSHVVTEQDVRICWDPTLVTCAKCVSEAASNGLLLCAINCEVVWWDEKMHVVLTKTSGSVSIWPNQLGPHATVAEVFSGGFAGWSFALKFLQSLGVETHSNLMIDHDRKAAFMAARNHDMKIAPENMDPRTTPMPSEQPLVVTADIQDRKWLILFTTQGTHIWLASPPCPAFSWASNMHGFLRKEGQMTLHLACCARLCQPFVVLIENVKGLAEQKFFTILVAMFKWAGYSCLFHENTELGDIGPCLRERWFGYFVRNDVLHRFRIPKSTWFRATDFKYQSFGLTRLEIPMEIVKLYTLTTQMESIYGDPKYLPKKMKPADKNLQGMTPREVCLLRAINADSKLATFVKCYGSQHELPKDFLDNSEGIFAQLIRFRSFFRFITPFEQCLCLAIPERVYIPVHPPLAYHFIGNCISPLQALYAISNLLQSWECPSMPKINPMQLVVQMHSHRLMPANVRITQQGDWFVMFGEVEPKVQLDQDLCFSPPDHQVVPVTTNPVIPDDGLSPPAAIFRLDTAAEAMIQKSIDIEVERQDLPVGRHCHEASILEHAREGGHDGAPGTSPTVEWTVPVVEPPNKRPCLAMNPEPKVTPFANVTIVFPHDVLNVRCSKGTMICNILTNHGYVADAFVVLEVNTGKDVMHLLVEEDVVVVARNQIGLMAPKIEVHIQELIQEYSKDVPKDQAVTTSIICQGVTLWKGILPKQLSLRTIHELTSKAFRRFGIHAECRWSKATLVINPFWEWKLSDLTNAGSVKLQAHIPFYGGAKDTILDEKFKAKLVGELANASVSFTQLMPVATAISNKHSVSKIKEILATPDAGERQSRILELAADSGYDPSSLHQKNRAARKIQKALRAKQDTKPKVIDTCSIRLCEGDFLNEDDSATGITIGEFSPNGHGLYLVQYPQVATWLRSAKAISTDELAVLMIGHESIDTTLPFKRIQFRASQAGGEGQLVLKGTLVQLGDKHVKSKTFKDTTVVCPDTIVAACTVYQSDFSPDEWSQVIKSPGKGMMTAFEFSLRKDAIMSLWGHSFQANGRSCKPALADSIQVHVRVKKSKLNEVLQQSGWNRVYMTPKNEDGSIANTTFSVLWTGMDFEQTQVQAKLLQSHLGLIRNRDRFGIRVHFDAFLPSWKILFPHADPPDQIKVSQLFRVQGIPHNVTNLEIRTWIQQLGWDAKPIRRVTHGVWIVGGAKMPDQEACSFNGNVVTIAPIDRKDTQVTNPVLAGKAVFSSEHVGISQGVTPEDPWAAYRKLHPPSVVPLNNTGNQPVARSLDGPTTTKLQEQDTKISILGQRLDQLQQQLDKDTTQLKGLISESDKSHTTNLQKLSEGVERRFGKQERELDHRFNTLQATIEAGKQSQDEQFRLLRDMLARTVATPTQPPRKAQKTEGSTTPHLSAHASEDER